MRYRRRRSFRRGRPSYSRRRRGRSRRRSFRPLVIGRRM